MPDFSWVGDVMRGWPYWAQMLIIFPIVYSGLKFIDIKYVQPRTQKKTNGHAALETKIQELETHVTNHLTTDIGELKTCINNLTSIITSQVEISTKNFELLRDMVEEAKRTNRSINVMLGKADELDKSIDQLDKSVIRVEAKIK